MVRTVVFVAGFLTIIGGASVIASGFVARRAVPAAPPIAAPLAPAVPRVIADEARWTTVPVVVARTDAYQRIAAVEAPRDINVAAEAAAPPIPLPPPRPPSTEWLRESDRTYLADWCRSERDARRLCRSMRQAGRAERDVRSRRNARSRVVVDIRRAERRQLYSAPRTVHRVIAYERSPMFDLMR